jgi:hypothetical protein
MASFEMTEKIRHLENTIAARKYLDQNEVALQILSKEEAEVDIHLAAYSLYLFFVNRALWCGFKPEEKGDVRDVRKALQSVSASITAHQQVKKLAELRLQNFDKFVAKHLPEISVKASC